MDERHATLIEFGSRVRELRTAKGLSQEQLGFACDLDRTYISGVERGVRNVGLLNVNAIARALGIPVSDLFGAPGTSPRQAEQRHVTDYLTRPGCAIECGFTVTSDAVAHAATAVCGTLSDLPFSLFRDLDLKTLSAITGALFSTAIAETVGAIVNPIEKGHPDVIPVAGRDASEAKLRNYGEGLEVKCTVGNVAKGSALQAGERRLPHLTGVTWQAHHREVGSMLGLVIDFAGREDMGRRYPVITAAFYSDQLQTNDWGAISGTRGRNTKVTGMLGSGKERMRDGWVIVIAEVGYQRKYNALLSPSRSGARAAQEEEGTSF
jgi:transcriptional regulator with XRE-family HTH domain